jgi:hypothetical protein
MRPAFYTIHGEKQTHSIRAVPDATSSMTPVASDRRRPHAHIPIHSLFIYQEYYRHQPIGNRVLDFEAIFISV